MNTSQSIDKIIPALLAVQRTVGAVTKDSNNPYFKSTYADINSFLETVVPVLSINDLVLSQPTSSDEKGHYVETVLFHSSGQWVSSGMLRMELTKADSQSLGSSITYCRRYSLQALLGLRAVDDDGEASMNRPTKTASAIPQVSSGAVSLPATTTETRSFRNRKPKAADVTLNGSGAAIAAPVVSDEAGF